MTFPLPPIALPADPLGYLIIAIAMVGIAIFVLGKVLPADARPPLLTQLIFGVAVIFGGSVLLMFLLYTFLNSNGTTTWTLVLLGFNFMMMVPVGLWFVSLILFHDRRTTAKNWSWPALLAFDVAGVEVLMGVLFSYGGSASPLTFFLTMADALTSVWFLWSMAAIMGAVLLWAPISRIEQWAFVALTFAATIAPWVAAYPTIGGVLMAVLMGALFGVLLRRLLKGAVRTEHAPFLLGLASAFLAMTLTGIAVAVTGAAPAAAAVFGSVMALVMGVESAYLYWRFYHGPQFPALVPRHPADEPAEGSAPRAPIVSGDPARLANR